MPYIIKRIKDGYKVCLKAHPNICFSNKTLSKDIAVRQMKAIIINENKKNKKNK